MTKQINLIDKTFLLKKTSLFGNLDLDLLLAISDKMESVVYKRGSACLKLGGTANKMYLITEGSVEIKSPRGEVFAEISAGDFFGDESIFSERPHAYEAYCLTDVLLLALSRSHLFSIISECPSVAINLLRVYTSPIDFRSRSQPLPL